MRENQLKVSKNGPEDVARKVGQNNTKQKVETTNVR